MSLWMKVACFWHVMEWHGNGRALSCYCCRAPTPQLVAYCQWFILFSRFLSFICWFLIIIYDCVVIFHLSTCTFTFKNTFKFKLSRGCWIAGSLGASHCCSSRSWGRSIACLCQFPHHSSRIDWPCWWKLKSVKFVSLHVCMKLRGLRLVGSSLQPRCGHYASHAYIDIQQPPSHALFQKVCFHCRLQWNPMFLQLRLKAFRAEIE